MRPSPETLLNQMLADARDLGAFANLFAPGASILHPSAAMRAVVRQSIERRWDALDRLRYEAQEAAKARGEYGLPAPAFTALATCSEIEPAVQAALEALA